MLHHILNLLFVYFKNILVPQYTLSFKKEHIGAAQLCTFVTVYFREGIAVPTRIVYFPEGNTVPTLISSTEIHTIDIQLRSPPF